MRLQQMGPVGGCQKFREGWQKGERSSKKEGNGKWKKMEKRKGNGKGRKYFYGKLSNRFLSIWKNMKTPLFPKFWEDTKLYLLKESRNLCFCVIPQKSSECLSHIFLQLRWRKLLKVAAFVIFLYSIILLFKIHQKFKGHFLNELRVSFHKCLYTISGLLQVAILRVNKLFSVN